MPILLSWKVQPSSPHLLPLDRSFPHSQLTFQNSQQWVRSPSQDSLVVDCMPGFGKARWFYISPVAAHCFFLFFFLAIIQPSSPDPKGYSFLLASAEIMHLPLDLKTEPHLKLHPKNASLSVASVRVRIGLDSTADLLQVLELGTLHRHPISRLREPPIARDNLDSYNDHLLLPLELTCAPHLVAIRQLRRRCMMHVRLLVLHVRSCRPR